jgi:DNA-binding transcriptional regulator YhcF (GntR family)
MRELIEKNIRGMERGRGALPSVRELAQELGASPQTVHKVLRGLAQEGLVHALAQKGYYWGAGDKGENPPRMVTTDERLKMRFLADLHHGVHHPWKELPARKALAQIYGVGATRVGRLLVELAERGILERRGRGYFLAPPPRMSLSTSVLVVVRCDASGEFLLETEREIDFLKSVRREFAEQGLGLVRLGWCEELGHFLDSSGREIDPVRAPGVVLGVLVSTWLVMDHQALLRRLSRLRLPLSVWWEHAAEEFPRVRSRAGLVAFNLSFGESAGAAVGRHLAALGQLNVAFVSPYHGNDWSRSRLKGLREVVEAHGGCVLEIVETECASPRHLQDLGGGEHGMHRLLEKTLSGFLEDQRLRCVPTWVMVNDLAAASMHRILRERGDVCPHLIGFDNSSDSERLGFDSFEFHTDGMVRQMLHHLAHPGAAFFAGDPVREMMGRMVVRTVSST